MPAAIDNQGQGALREDNIITFEPEVDVPLQVAWQVLSQCGYAVALAVRQDTRKRRWLVREVHPEELAARTVTAPAEPRRSARSTTA